MDLSTRKFQKYTHQREVPDCDLSHMEAMCSDDDIIYGRSVMRLSGQHQPLEALMLAAVYHATTGKVPSDMIFDKLIPLAIVVEAEKPTAEEIVALIDSAQPAAEVLDWIVWNKVYEPSREIIPSVVREIIGSGDFIAGLTDEMAASLLADQIGGDESAVIIRR